MQSPIFKVIIFTMILAPLMSLFFEVAGTPFSREMLMAQIPPPIKQPTLQPVGVSPSPTTSIQPVGVSPIPTTTTQPAGITPIPTPLIQPLSTTPIVPAPPTPLISTATPAPTSGTLEIILDPCVDPLARFYLTLSEFDKVSNGMLVIDQVSDTCGNLITNPFSFSNLVFTVPYSVSLVDGISGNTAFEDHTLTQIDPIRKVNLSPQKKNLTARITTPFNPGTHRLELLLQRFDTTTRELFEVYTKELDDCNNQQGCDEELFIDIGDYIVTLTNLAPGGNSESQTVSPSRLVTPIIVVDFSNFVPLILTPQPIPIAQVGEIQVSVTICVVPNDRFYLTLLALNQTTNNYEVLEEVSELCSSFLKNPMSIQNLPLGINYIVGMLNGANGYTNFTTAFIDQNQPLVKIDLDPQQQSANVDFRVFPNLGINQYEIRVQRLSRGNTFEAFWKIVGNTGVEIFSLEPGEYTVEISIPGKKDFVVIDTSDPTTFPDFSGFFPGTLPGPGVAPPFPTASPIPSFCPEYDLNGDLIIDTADVDLMIQVILGSLSCPVANCDVNNDSNVDIFDMQEIILFATGSSPFCPSQGPGPTFLRPPIGSPSLDLQVLANGIPLGANDLAVEILPNFDPVFCEDSSTNPDYITCIFTQSGLTDLNIVAFLSGFANARVTVDVGTVPTLAPIILRFFNDSEQLYQEYLDYFNKNNLTVDDLKSFIDFALSIGL